MNPTTNSASRAQIDLDKLEALARAAAQHGDDIGEEEWYSTSENVSLSVGNPDLNLIAACSPVAVLALIALARAAQPAPAVSEQADERALFEAWATGRAKTLERTRDGAGEYAEYATQAAFAAWQARAALAQRASGAPVEFARNEKHHGVSDIITAAGLLSHGRTDKKLARRIADFAWKLNAELHAASTATPASAQPAEQDRRALELANRALIASRPTFPDGWTRHEAAINATASALHKPKDTASAQPADPMDWPLPCDVKVGAGTIKKGCKLRTLVTRMTMLHDMAMHGFHGPRTAAAGAQPADMAGDVELIRVPAHEADSYCRILSILGMEEEGDPVAEVQRLVDAASAQPVAAAPRVPEPSRASRIECALRQIIEADDDQGLTQDLIESGRSALAAIDAAPVAAAPAETLTPLDYRAQGREEALAIILAEDPENPFADHTHSYQIADTGDYGTEWDEKALRELLHIGDRKHDAFDRAEAAYWDALGTKEEAEREMLFVKQAPFYEPLHAFLAKHEAWDLMGDLKRATAPAAPVVKDENTTPAARDVLAERRRQVEVEGMTNNGDDRYQAAELPRAAASYILNGANDEAPAIWPWAKTWWKPRDARANYVRAASLLLAEIERIDRARPSAKQKGSAKTWAAE